MRTTPPRSPDAPARCTVTLTSWPETMTENERMETLVHAMGMDAFTARQFARKELPLILGQIAKSMASSVARVFADVHASAVVVADEDVAQLPKPVQVRRLVPALGAPHGMYQASVHGPGERSIILDCRRLRLIVRAGVAKTFTRTQEDPALRPSPYGPMASPVHGGWSPPPQTTVTKTSVSQIVDLWTVTPDPAGRITPESLQCIRVNGDRFNWDVLPSKGLSDNVNADALCVLLADQAPHAHVDTGFSEFARANRHALDQGWTVSPSGTKRIDRGPLLEYYTAWSMICLLKANAGR